VSEMLMLNLYKILHMDELIFIGRNLKISKCLELTRRHFENI